MTIHSMNGVANLYCPQDPLALSSLKCDRPVVSYQQHTLYKEGEYYFHGSWYTTGFNP